MAGGHGGARAGAGRPLGSRDRVNRYVTTRLLEAEVTEFLRTNSVAIFEGDSLELAISIYKNENLPIGMRLHAAALALPFERPRLVASASVTKHIDGGGDAEFGRLFQQIEQRLALAPPERRAEIVELLRDGPDEG